MHLTQLATLSGTDFKKTPRLLLISELEWLSQWLPHEPHGTSGSHPGSLVSFLLLCLHSNWKLWLESLRAAPRGGAELLEKHEPQPGPPETHENKWALTCLSAQEKVSGSGPFVVLPWVKRVSWLPSCHESLMGGEKLRCSHSLPRYSSLPCLLHHLSSVQMLS